MDKTQTNNQTNQPTATVDAETEARIERISDEMRKGFSIINKYPRTVTVFGSARFKEDSPYYAQAREISRKLTETGYTIVTGGGGGIMEAANRGAFEAGGDSIGFNIKLPHEQVLNDYTTEELPFRYFFTRKVLLAYGAVGYICFPGGFGTMDEAYEVLTLLQTQKMATAPVVLIGKKFWSGLDTFVKEHLLDGAMTISAGDEELYTITDDVDEAVAIINAHRDTKLAHPL